MNTKLQQAADVVRTAVNHILNGPIPEAIDENKFEMYIPNFVLENDETATVRVMVDATRLLVISELGEMKNECRKSVTEAMNKCNREMTQTRVVLHRGHINMESACFIYDEHEHNAERIEKVILHYLGNLYHNSGVLKAANESADIGTFEDDDDTSAGSGKINFHLFDS